MSLTRYNAKARLSDAVVANGIIFTAGRVPKDTSLDAYGQVMDVLNQIDKLLADLNSDKTKIIDTTIFLADLADYDALNAAWDSWIISGLVPARATVQAKLANPLWKVEIKVIALQN